MWCWIKYIKLRFYKSSGTASNQCRNCKWSSSSIGSFKLNVDGAYNLFSGLVSSTVMIRDEYGRWLWGIEKNIERGSIEQSELRVIYDNLHLA